jgi:cell wall-associated NlpC family hydrolase
MMGVNLLRDAWLQAGQGMKVKTLQQAECGDLAFFTHKKRKITHVGILLGPSQIVHASGKVRIDAIDDEGIINSDSGKRTHTLVAIRKVW